jgi:CRP-like cAMP-binding protein
LFEDGAPGEQIYLLAKGEVEILFALGENNLAVVDRLGGGQVFGCSTLVPPYTYRATARSLDEIEVLIVDAAKLRESMQADCSLGFSVQQHLIQVLLDQIIDLQLGS